MSGAEFLFILLILVVWYLLPSIVALLRRHHNAFAIFLLNLFLGWSLVGWVVALVWAYTRPAPLQQVVVHLHHDHTDLDE